MNIVMVGPFGLAPKQTMRARALPMARALAARGHRVSMLLPPWSNPADSGRAYDDAGVRIINLRLPPPIPGSFHAALGLNLARRALTLKPDVIHLFKPKAFAGLAHACLHGWRLAGLHRARLVVDTDDWEGAGGWNAIEPYHPLLKYFFAWQERWGLTHADAVTVASRALETIVWSLGVARRYVAYAPNGVTPSEQPIAAARPAAPAVLLYTRFFEFDLARVARLLVALAERDSSVRFVIAGRGFRGEEDALRRMLEGTVAAARCDWRGWVEPADLPALFAQASLSIYPFDDTLLNRAKCAVKLGELLNAGVPVVAEAVGQNSEYIVDGESGVLVPPGDGGAFADAVLRLLANPALAARLAAGAQARMQREFAWGQIAARVEAAYAA